MTKYRDKGHKVALAYNMSRDALRIHIPDRLHFPSQQAWVWLPDTNTICVSTDRPDNGQLGARLVSFTKERDDFPERLLVVQEVKHIGPHFRVMDVVYQREGNTLTIQIPEESKRKPPIRHTGPRGHWKTTKANQPEPERRQAERRQEDRRVPAPTPKASSEGQCNVMLDINGETLCYHAPAAVLICILDLVRGHEVD